MKKLLLTFFYCAFFSIVVTGTETGPLKDIIEEGHRQIAQFIQKNEDFKKKGLLDSLNYIYVYVPGEEFDFHRSVDDKFNIVNAEVQELDWILDEDDKLATTLAAKLNNDLALYNNKKIFTPGPDSEWDTADDEQVYFQQYWVVVDGPKNFLNGYLNSVPDRIGMFTQLNWIESLVNNIYDYETKYNTFQTDFVASFPLPEIFDEGDQYQNSIIFSFTNPQLKELAGVAAGSTTVDKVNVQVDLKVKQISEPNSFEELLEDVEFKVYLPGPEIVAAPITGLSQGLLSVKEFIYDQIKAVHGQDVPTAKYFECEYFETKLNYEYSKTWFNIKCALHPNHKGYQSFIRESALFLELIAYYGKQNATLLGGTNQTFKQFVDAKIDKYVDSPDFDLDIDDPNQYLVWLHNEYDEHETLANKIQHYVRVYYRYFIQVDQQSGEEIIHATKAMFSQIQIDGITWWEWYNKKFDLNNEDKTEDAWSEFYEGLIALNTGAYEEDIYQQMYEIISIDLNLLWDHVLLPIPRSGQGLFQGVKLPWVGVNSMDMGTELSKFIIKYYQETGQDSKLMLDETELENFVPFVVHGTLNTNWGVWGGLPYLTTSFVAMDYTLVDGNISFEYCVQEGIPPASRYNCSDAFYTGITTLKTFEGTTKPFFDMVYSVETEAQDYIDESEKIKDVKNAFIEPAFFTALKIVNRDFDRKLEYAAAGVSIALLPYTASAAGIGSLYEFLYFGGLVADVNFTILNVAGTQNTQEYLENVYGEENGQDYYNYFVTGNTILGGGAFVGGAVQISASAYAKMKAISEHFDDVYIYNYTKELPYTENSTGLVVIENGVTRTKSVFKKFDKDFKSAFSEADITDLVYNAKSGMYEVPEVSSTLMLSEEAQSLRQVLDRARYEIARLPAPSGGAVTPAYQISNTIAELSVNGKLSTFMSDLNSDAAGFKNYFSYSTSVEEFAKKVKAWEVLDELDGSLKTDISVLAKLVSDIDNNPILISAFQSDIELFNLWKQGKWSLSSVIGNSTITNKVAFLKTWNKIIIAERIRGHVYHGDVVITIKVGGSILPGFPKKFKATYFLSQTTGEGGLIDEVGLLQSILQNHPDLVNNIKHNLKVNQLNAETDVIHLTLTGLHGGHYVDPANSNIFGQPGSTVTYLSKPNTNGLPYNPDPNIMPPVVTTSTVTSTQIGVDFNDGTKALEVAPATVRVLDKDGWIELMNNGIISDVTDASKLIHLKKGNNSAGLASLYMQGIPLNEVEELVSIAFSSPSKIWNVGGNPDRWESVILFKGRNLKFQGFGTKGSGGIETDALSTAFPVDVQ